MGRLVAIWRSWSVRRRVITVAVAAAIAAGAGVGLYQWLKRPADVSNPDVEFVEQDDQPIHREPVDKTVDWPTYGYNSQRTRYFPTKVVNAPFGSSDWSFHTGKLLEFSPIVVDDRLYFMDIDTNFYALDAETGKKLWETKTGSLNASAPTYRDGRLFAVNLEPGQAIALRARDGKKLWDTRLGGRSESSPLVYRDLVIFGCECGTVYALDTKDGSIEWQYDTAGAIKGALALDGGVVYGGNYAGEMFALKADSGDAVWRVNTIGGSFGRGGGVYSTPAVAYGRVYFGSIDSRVYSLDQETGQIAWSHSTGAEVYSGPAIADTAGTPATVYIGSADSVFYALDAKTGDTRWTQPAGGQVTGAASVIGDVVYVSVIGEAVGTIGYAVKDGEVVFEHELGEYNPAITDGQRLYLTGYSTLRAFTPNALERKERQAKKKRQDAAGGPAPNQDAAPGDGSGASKASGPQQRRKTSKKPN